MQEGNFKDLVGLLLPFLLHFFQSFSSKTLTHSLMTLKTMLPSYEQYIETENPTSLDLRDEDAGLTDSGHFVTDLELFHMPTKKQLEAYESIEGIKIIHNKIVQLALAGETQVSIAQTLGVSASMVGNVLKSEMAKEQIRSLTLPLQEATLELHKQVKGAAVLGLQTSLSIMTDDETPSSIKLKAAQDLMDRGGLPKTTQVNTATVDLNRIEELRLNFLNKKEEENG